MPNVRSHHRPSGRKTSAYGPPVPSSIRESQQLASAGAVFADVGGFVATAYGPPWGGIEGQGVTSTGVTLKDGEPAYIVAVDPAVIPYHSKLKIWPNPFGNRDIVFSAEDTGGAIRGRRIDFYDWRGRASQNRWGRRSVQVRTAGVIKGLEKGSLSVAAGGAPGSSSSGSGGDSGSGDGFEFGGILGWGQAIMRLAATILDASKWGPLLSDVFAFMLRTLARSLWKYLISPPWHWTQRASIYYWEQIMTGRSGDSVPRRTAGIITAAFWGIGWACLFAKADSTSFGTSAGNTPLGRTAQSAQLAFASRKLHSPKDVEKNTPKKPPTVTSRVPLTVTRTLATARKRTVKVTEHGRDIVRNTSTGNVPMGTSERSGENGGPSADASEE